MVRVGFYKYDSISWRIVTTDPDNPAQELHISNPEELTDAEVRSYGYLPVYKPEPLIDFNPDVAKVGGLLFFDDKLEYSVVALQTVVQNSPAQRIDRLWRAADRYEKTYISGSGTGLVTIGVIQQKPKCLEVAIWVQSIWTRYYGFRAQLVTGAELTPEMLDFSECGPIPHAVLELMEEVAI
jgi:hypothetical protein